MGFLVSAPPEDNTDGSILLAVRLDEQPLALSSWYSFGVPGESFRLSIIESDKCLEFMSPALLVEIW